MLFDNTGRIKKLAENYDLPPTPAGNQEFQFNVWDTVEHNGKGTVRAGVRETIIDRYKENGFCYYTMENGATHRQQDLNAI